MSTPQHDGWESLPHDGTLPCSGRMHSTLPYLFNTPSQGLASSIGVRGQSHRLSTLVQNAYAPSSASTAFSLPTPKGHNNQTSSSQLPHPIPSQVVASSSECLTDASQSGWGAHLENLSVAGTWSPTEKLLHINLLELLAVQKALQHMTN